ncbi:PUA domain-containing RNA-binding protein, putative, partial [Ixodes scapularis]
RRFDEKEHVSGITQLKSSVQKAIKNKIVEQFPTVENYINQILPKKDSLRIVKCHDHIEILVNGNGELLFFRQREGQYFPTLRLLHKCESETFPGMSVFGMNKKTEMRSPFSAPMKVTPSKSHGYFGQGQVEAIMAEGKEHSLAIGYTAMSTDDIATINKGIGVENIHYLNDGLWHMKPVK